MRKMNRDDIWYVDLGGHAGRRPVVILTRQAVLQHLNKVTVAEVSTRDKGYPTEVFIGDMANLPSPSFVQADNLHTVPKQRLVKYSGTLDEATMRKTSRKVVLALGLE
ncbi:MAG: type II toxin-antitoxin system PemK/MazF family toxin [Spirochaetia bacterium]|nr:type II toxin-antitoxin system PemK/MazF family toxin [Spirochaetia bacterium]